jgi:hypothetical protein
MVIDIPYIKVKVVLVHVQHEVEVGAEQIVLVATSDHYLRELRHSGPLSPLHFFEFVAFCQFHLGLHLFTHITVTSHVSTVLFWTHSDKFMGQFAPNASMAKVSSTFGTFALLLTKGKLMTFFFSLILSLKSF